MKTLVLEEPLQQKLIQDLATCPLFRTLRPENLQQVLRVGTLLSFDPDEVIIRKGDKADTFFVLVDGEATVLGGSGSEPVEIGVMSSPSSVGEVGLLLAELRTASIVARTPVTAVRFDSPAFNVMFQKIPNFGLGISQGLAHRLQQLSGRIPLPDFEMSEGEPRAEALRLLPSDFIQRHRLLPIRTDGTTLLVGVTTEPSAQAMNAARALLPGMEIRPVRISPWDFDEAIRHRVGVEGWQAPIGWEPTGAAPEVLSLSPRLDRMLERMVAEGASDLHLSAGDKPYFRIDGELSPIGESVALKENEVLELLVPVMQDRHRSQFREDNDSDFAYELPGRARFRVNVFRDARGVGAVLRLIPSEILTAEQLGLPQVVKSFCEIPKGLVLVTGPTGSGKSTTLAAMIDHINRTKKAHIVTLEDPIEFVHRNNGCLINQREVGGHTKTFARALKAVLREDPDIVLVGEMRDLETIALTLEVANTGHLVFATLHTNSAISAIDRIIDMFPADQQNQVRTTLADVLRGVVAQTLLRKRGGGRIAALEVLVSNFAVANLIREAKSVQIPTIMQANKSLGMQMLNDELARLVDKRKVDYAEALSKAVDKLDFAKRFGKTLSPSDGLGLPAPAGAASR